MPEKDVKEKKPNMFVAMARGMGTFVSWMIDTRNHRSTLGETLGIACLATDWCISFSRVTPQLSSSPSDVPLCAKKNGAGVLGGVGYEHGDHHHNAPNYSNIRASTSSYSHAGRFPGPKFVVS
eukprot:4374323-Pyramimonas_sp.AAC.1